MSISQLKEANPESTMEEIQGSIELVEKNVNIIFQILSEYEKILETKKGER